MLFAVGCSNQDAKITELEFERTLQDAKITELELERTQDRWRIGAHDAEPQQGAYSLESDVYRWTTDGLDYQLWENVISRVEWPSQDQDAYELTDADYDASALEADYSGFLTLGIWTPRMKKKNPKLLKPKK